MIWEDEKDAIDKLRTLREVSDSDKDNARFMNELENSKTLIELKDAAVGIEKALNRIADAY
jgi:hypothetical protein